MSNQDSQPTTVTLMIERIGGLTRVTASDEYGQIAVASDTSKKKAVSVAKNRAERRVGSLCSFVERDITNSL